MKYLLHDIYGVDDTTRSFKIHNISRLIDQIHGFDPEFIRNHAELQALAGTVTEWEAHSRYEDVLRSTYSEVRNALGVAERLYEEVRAIDAARSRNRNEELAEDAWTGFRPEGEAADGGICCSGNRGMLSFQDDEDDGPRT